MSSVAYIISGLIAALCLILILIVGIRYFKRKRQKNLGKNIELQIDPKITLDSLIKKANFFAQEKQYVQAIIYLFYYFRKFCEKYYRIKNAISMKCEELPSKLAGFNFISMNKLNKILALYDSAYYNTNNLTYDDFILIKNFVLNLPRDL